VPWGHGLGFVFVFVLFYFIVYYGKIFQTGAGGVLFWALIKSIRRLLAKKKKKKSCHADVLMIFFLPIGSTRLSATRSLQRAIPGRPGGARTFPPRPLIRGRSAGARGPSRRRRVCVFGTYRLFFFFFLNADVEKKRKKKKNTYGIQTSTLWPG
jgi:hypothetical protein